MPNGIMSGTEKKGILEGIPDQECCKAKIRNHCSAFSIKQQKRILTVEHRNAINKSSLKCNIPFLSENTKMINNTIKWVQQ